MSRLAQLSKYPGAYQETLGRWFQANSLAPNWLPQRWQQPVVGYLLSLGLIVLALALEVLALQRFPNIEIAGGLFVFLVILFIGMNWGAGPCVLATALRSEEHTSEL